MRRGLRGLAVVVLALLTSACARTPVVVRGIDGELVPGRYVGRDAYAAFLEGALAEADGDMRRARSAFRRAVDEDDDSALAWSRLARAHCALGEWDDARAALRKAQSRDASLSSVAEARAECLERRGDRAGAARELDGASALAPYDSALLPRQVALTARPSAAQRDRIIALTLARSADAAAWRALRDWARAREDDALLVAAYRKLLVGEPRAFGDGARDVRGLIERGSLDEARALAEVLASRAHELRRRLGDGLVARLAVDAALASGDVAGALRHAKACGASPDLVMERAALRGDQRRAVDAARAVLEADPTRASARAVMALVGEASPEVLWAGSVAGSLGGDVAAPLALRLLRRHGAVASRAFWEGAVPTLDREAHLDPALRGLLVELVAHTVVAESAVAPELAIEAAARRGSVPPVAAVRSRAHRLLAASLRRQALDASEWRDMAQGEDVAVAAVAASFAAEHDALPSSAGAQLRGALERARDAAPGDPLVLAALVRAARRRGDGPEAARWADALAAVCTTDYECALAGAGPLSVSALGRQRPASALSAL